jgi:hypothetical protein
MIAISPTPAASPSHNNAPANFGGTLADGGDARAQQIAGRHGLTVRKRLGTRFEACDIPTQVVVIGTEVPIFKRRLGVRANRGERNVVRVG